MQIAIMIKVRTLRGEGISAVCAGDFGWGALSVATQAVQAFFVVAYRRSCCAWLCPMTFQGRLNWLDW
jgi:hypothetical protein